MPGKDTLWMLYDTSAITSMLDFKASAEFTRALDTEHRAEQLVHFFAAASQAAAKESRGSVWGAPNAFTGMLNSSDLRNDGCRFRSTRQARRRRSATLLAVLKNCGSSAP